MSTHYTDLLDTSRSSNCCGAAIYMGDICSQCKEHCDDAEEDDPGELKADYERTYWKDEGKAEREEMIERMCKDAEEEDKKYFSQP